MVAGRLRFASIVVTAEHASNRIPPELAGLGLEASILESHVAWDPGVAEVASQVAKSLDAPLFAGSWSRLVADLNRSPDSLEVVPEIAFGVAIPGNANLSADARRARIAAYHTPYWSKVRRELDSRPHPVLHFSVHSFTGELHGKKRELDLGLLFDPDRPLEAELARHLERDLRTAGFDARANEPYDGRADALVTANRALYAPDTYCGFELELSHNLLARLDEIARACTASLRAVLHQ